MQDGDVATRLLDLFHNIFTDICIIKKPGFSHGVFGLERRSEVSTSSEDLGDFRHPWTSAFFYSSTRYALQ